MDRISGLSRYGIHSVAVKDGKTWVLWKALFQDRSQATYVSELTGPRDVQLEQSISPYDLAFTEDGSLLILGLHPEFPELIWRFGTDGRLLSSFFVDDTIASTVLSNDSTMMSTALSSESRLLVNGNRMYFFVPMQSKVFEMTREGALIHLYEFDEATEMPRSAFQGPDGSVYVDLFFGTKGRIPRGPDKGAIFFRDPGVRIVRLDNGVLEEVLSIPPAVHRQPLPTFRGLINGQLVQEWKGLLTWQSAASSGETVNVPRH